MASTAPALPSPARRSQGIAVRRGVVLVLMSLIVPGSAQVAAGNKKLGRFALGVWLTLVALLIALGIALLAARGPVIGFLANPIVLTVLAWLVPVVGLAWIVLLVDAWRIANPGHMSGVGRAVTGVMALALSVVLGVVSWGAHGVLNASAAFVGDVFVGGGSAQVEDGRINVLLLGGDAGADRWGLRPDSMTVASIDVRTGRTVLFGLPRNLQWAPFPADSPLHAMYPNGYWCKTQECLLNAIYTLAVTHKKLFPGVKYPGVEATKGAIEEILGLKINYWAMIDLKGFQQLIDAVGGINLDIAQRVPIGSKSGPKGVYGYIEPGKNVHLDGFHALWFARSREGADDYQRMARQKCVMNAMVQQLNPSTVFTKFEAIANAGKQIVATNLPSSEIGTMLDLAAKVKDVPMGSVSLTPPLITPAKPDFPRIREIVQQAIADSQAKDAPTQAPTQVPAASPSAKPSPKPSPSPNTTDDLSTICSVSK